jgi:hypothetical protein
MDFIGRRQSSQEVEKLSAKGLLLTEALMSVLFIWFYDCHEKADQDKKNLKQ